MTQVQRLDLSIPELLDLLESDNADIQTNALAYLQHVTFENENIKEVIRLKNGILLILPFLHSSHQLLQLNASGVIRNLSYGPNIQIKKELGKERIVERIESLLESSSSSMSRLVECLVAILCNLSSCTSFHSVLSESCLSKLVHFVLLPSLGMKTDPLTNCVRLFKINDLTVAFGPLLEFVTSFLKNMSSGPNETRQIMRTCEGLLDSITAIIQFSFNTEAFNSRPVENCVCIIRNLCYSFHEMFHSNDRYSFSKKTSKTKKDSIQYYNSRQLEDGGQMLLWNLEMLDLLLEIINFSKNYLSIEAAIGAVQNLACCKSKLAEEFRINFRKKKGLPSLVIHVINGPDAVVKVAIVALRNLSEDQRNLELIGSHALIHMLQCLPSPSKPNIKRILDPDSLTKNFDFHEEYLSLNTMYSILSFVYFLLYTNNSLIEVFVKKNGVKTCIYLLSSDLFYQEHLDRSNSGQAENADKLPIVAAQILQLIWEQSKYLKTMKKENFKCEDFCVRSNFEKFKSALYCVNDDEAPVYYGKPYTKARSNTLLSMVYTPRHTPKIIITRDEDFNRVDKNDFQKPLQKLQTGNETSSPRRTNDNLWTYNHNKYKDSSERK